MGVVVAHAANPHDARLIAAAPALYAALLAIVDNQGRCSNGFPLSENQLREWAVANFNAREALALATGEQS